MTVENGKNEGASPAQALPVPEAREAPARPPTLVQRTLPGRWPAESPRPVAAHEPESSPDPNDWQRERPRVDPKQRTLW